MVRIFPLATGLAGLLIAPLPFVYAGPDELTPTIEKAQTSIWDQQCMPGDWSGERTELAKEGVTFDLKNIGDFLTDVVAWDRPNSLALFVMLYFFSPTFSYFGLSISYGITLPLAAFFYGAFTIQSGTQNYRGDSLRWREPSQINDARSASLPVLAKGIF